MVANLGLSIALRVIRRGESVGDLILSAEAGYLFAGKVRFIVGDNGGREPEATHYVLPEELNLLPGDF